MNARQWVEWVSSIRSFASNKGMIIQKIMTSKDQESELVIAHVVANNKEIVLKNTGPKGKLEFFVLGIPIIFTPKLPSGRCVFRLKDDS